MLSGSSLTMFVLVVGCAQAGQYATFSIHNSNLGRVTAVNDSGVMVGSWGRINASKGIVRAADGTITTFRVPHQGAGRDTVPFAINNRAVVTGYFTSEDNVDHGFVRNVSGHFASFDPPGSARTYPASINDAGAITGNYYDSNGVIHGFVRASDGTFVSFDAPGAGTATNQGTFPSGINATGAIAGSYRDANNAFHGFLFPPGGNIVTIDVSGALGWTFAYAVNSSGAVVGTCRRARRQDRGFVRAPDGTITTFDSPKVDPHGFGTQAYALNDRGDIAGTYYDTDGTAHGFVRHADAQMETIDAPGAGQGSTNYAGTFINTGGINAQGDLAGTLVTDQSQQLGFVQTH